MSDLRTAAQQALETIEDLTRDRLFSAEWAGKHGATITALRAALAQQDESDAYGYASYLAVAIWEKYYKDTAPDWKPLDDLVGVLTQIDNMTSGLTRLAQQAEPQGCATEEDCTKQPWCRIRGECQRKQAEPLNLRDPAVRKRLATQWGYVPAAQAEPVEPVAWYRPSIAPDYYAPVFVEGAQPPAPLTQAEARLLGWRPLVPPKAEPVAALTASQPCPNCARLEDDWR